MSVQAIAWVLEQSESRLSARHVLISIANHAKSDGTDAWPSVATIARESRLSVSEVHSSLRDLQVLGELSIARAAGPHGCNLYTLQKMQSAESVGVQNKAGGVQNTDSTPPESVPEPSLTVHKPSVKQAKQSELLPPKYQSEHFSITMAQDAKLADTYPWVDRLQEYRKMSLWFDANPSRRVRKVLAFVSNWFSKIACPTVAPPAPRELAGYPKLPEYDR